MKTYYAWIEELSRFLSVGLLCFIFLELIIPGSVVSIFKLNYWLILWLINGILLLFLKPINK
jgi:hypothetical protein